MMMMMMMMMLMIYGLLGTKIGSIRPIRSCGKKITIR